jgi:hypothetical protein
LQQLKFKNMSEDRFFQQVKSVMSDYRPEVPGHVYEGARKKMWWSNFMRFDASRLNVWYIALTVGVAATIIMNVGQPASTAAENLPAPVSSESEVAVSPAAAPAMTESAVNKEGQAPAEVSTVRNTAVQKDAPSTAKTTAEEVVTTDVAAVEVAKEAEQVKSEEPQQMKNESQAPAKANKRGLKVKTYSPESDKK